MDPREIQTNRLFGDLAYLWPVMSPPEEYAEEAHCWRQVLWNLLGPERHRILELGVGGGHNLSHLAPDLDATAVDISADMLRLSVRLNPGVEHILGDMRCLRLGRTFDAVLIHDAISCITTARDLASVFATAAAHLEPGGPLILAPEYFPETLTLPSVDCRTMSANGIDLTYVEYTYDPDTADTALDVIFTYFIRQAAELRIEHDRLQVGFFPRSTWRRLMHAAGFEYSERLFHLPAANIPYTLLLGTLRGE